MVDFDFTAQQREDMFKMTPALQKEFEGASFFGIPLADLTHDELKFVVAWAMRSIRDMWDKRS